VGWLAEKAFGFEGAAETSEDLQANLHKARSLGSALLVFTALPWALCAVFFSGLHWTYPRDKLWAEQQILMAHPASMEMVEPHVEVLDAHASELDEEKQRLTDRNDSALAPLGRAGPGYAAALRSGYAVEDRETMKVQL
jgi:hypothetical protein